MIFAGVGNIQSVQTTSGTHLVRGYAVSERLLHAISRYGTDDEIGKPRFKGDEQIQDSNL